MLRQRLDASVEWVGTGGGGAELYCTDLQFK
jgi:hypothetical protein